MRPAHLYHGQRHGGQATPNDVQPPPGIPRHRHIEHDHQNFLWLAARQNQINQRNASQRAAARRATAQRAADATAAKRTPVDAHAPVGQPLAPSPNDARA